MKGFISCKFIKKCIKNNKTIKHRAKFSLGSEKSL